MSETRGEKHIESLSFSCCLGGTESFHAEVEEDDGQLDVFCMCTFDEGQRWRVHFWPKFGSGGESTFLTCGTADEVGEFLLAREAEAVAAKE